MTEDQKRILDECLERDEGLRGNEINFLDNLNRKWRDKPLTGPQKKWLEDIHGRGA